MFVKYEKVPSYVNMSITILHDVVIVFRNKRSFKSVQYYFLKYVFLVNLITQAGALECQQSLST